MSANNKLEDWIKNMGYQDEIPASLNIICNPSTTFIWEQIMSNVVSREKVMNIRKNLIINRLKVAHIKEQDISKYPISEIEIYLKKQALNNKMKMLERNIEEKESVVNELLGKNKETYITIERMKQNMNESSEKIHLYKKKCQMFKTDIEEAQEILTLACNVTPIEMEKSSSDTEITETLQKCAKKLEKIAEGMPNVASNKLNTTYRGLSTSILGSKSSLKTLQFSKYIKTQSSTNLPAKEPLKELNIAASLISTEIEIHKEKKPEKKRESLGLLPDNCLNLSNEFDETFLFTPSKNETCFSSVKSPNNSFLFESAKDPNFELVDKLCNEKLVKSMLKELLHKNNRSLILNILERMYESLLSQIRDTTLQFNQKPKLNEKNDISDSSQLYFTHIKYEIQKKKCQSAISNLQKEINKRKDEILLINTWSNAEEARNKLDIKIEEIQLLASNNFLREELNFLKNIQTNDEIKIIMAKIKQIKSEITCRIDNVENLIKNIYKILEFVKTNRDETSSFIAKLGPCIFDLSWANRLQQNLNSTEVEIFRKFPLEFNRKFQYTDSKQFYRNISSTIPSSIINLNSNNRHLISTIIDAPFSNPEVIIFNYLKNKLKLNTLRELPSEPLNLQFEHYSLSKLYQREEYIEDTINKFNVIINSTLAKKVMSLPERMQEVTNLWLEMPLRKYISEKRQVEGHSYKFYEKVFDNADKKRF